MRSAVLVAFGAAAFAALVLAAPLAALPDAGSPPRFANPLLETVVMMTRAEVPTKAIIAYLRVRRVLLQTDVETSDLVALREEGVAEDVIAYVAKASHLDVPPLPPSPKSGTGDGPEAPPPTDPDADEGKARPVEPDPGDTGLIMGVYDPIPTGGYPCWPAFLAPYECGDHVLVVWDNGGGSQTREASSKRGKPGNPKAGPSTSNDQRPAAPPAPASSSSAPRSPSTPSTPSAAPAPPSGARSPSAAPASSSAPPTASPQGNTKHR